MRRAVAAARGEVSWGFVDQGFSSATNFALAVIAGQLIGADGLGVVFLGFTAYLLAQSFQRALIANPLVVLSSRLGPANREAVTRAAFSLVLVAIVGVTALLVVLGLVIPGPLGRGLLIFAPWTGAAMLQDMWRAVLFRDRRGAGAAVNDGVWALAMLGTLPIALAVRQDWAIVIPWGSGAAIGAVLGWFQIRLVPDRIRPAWSWWRSQAWPLGRWFGLDNLLYVIQSQVVVFSLAVILGAASIGGLRAVQAVFAPMTLLSNALELPGLPLLSRELGVSAARARFVAARLSALALTAVAVYLLVFGLFRETVIRVVFGSTFTRFTDLVLPVGAHELLAAVSVGFVLFLKAQRRGRALIVVRIVGDGAVLVLAVWLAATRGLLASAWGMTAASAISLTVLLFLALRDGRVRSAPDPA